MAINFSTSGLETQKYASNIARIYHFEDATHNIGISDSAASIIIEFNFTKAYADTNIILWGIHQQLLSIHMRGVNIFQSQMLHLVTCH